MTGSEYETEYKDFFAKYLANIETPYNPDVDKSPLSRIPKPLDREKWIILCIYGLVGCLVSSFLLSLFYDTTNCWLLNWFSNALLSLSLGIAASLLIMAYTNAREKNVAFYSDIMPILESRYENMHKAYSEYALKINRYFYAGKYEECYYAWKANCNTCLVILDFLRYLHSVLPFQPESLTFSLPEIEKAADDLTKTNDLVTKEFFSQNAISKKTAETCFLAANCGSYGLRVIEELIQEFKCNLYGIKYGKTSKYTNILQKRRR